MQLDTILIERDSSRVTKGKALLTKFKTTWYLQPEKIHCLGVCARGWPYDDVADDVNYFVLSTNIFFFVHRL